MTSPGGRIEIRVDPDLTGFSSRMATELGGAARTGIGAFTSAARLALAGSAAVLGVGAIAAARSTLNIGIEYQNQLNTLQAVTGATGAELARVSETARRLGSDLALPATSAADAAAVMTELAKASFTVEEAQQAARGSIQLAAAAQIDGARAAEIQANAINAFSLSAGDAGRVADVLANAANASSAEITDIADALAQASAVAASAGISIEDTATAIGILANNGIKGADAGTLIKSALLALQSPSTAASKAMRRLGLEAYDAEGNFVGLSSVFEQLSQASATMTDEQYAAATSTLFGSDAARLAGIAAKEGGAGFDEMAAAISRQGAAAEVAAAKSQGLGGAIDAFKSQVETVQIDFFERAAPSLERLVRLAAERLPEIAETALDTVDRAVGYFQDVAPQIGRALESRRAAVADAWERLAQPIVEGAGEIGDEVLDLVADVAGTLEDLAETAVDKVEPLAQAVGDLVESLDDAGGPLETTGDLLGVVAGAAGLALDAAGPLIDLVAGLVSGFAELPGPLQSSVLALAALKLATSGVLGGRGGGGAGGDVGLASPGLGARISAPFREFAQTVGVQMALADDSITRSQAFQGGIATAIERQAPRVSGAFAQIRGAYQGGIAEAAQATERYGLAADGFAQRVSGLGRATQTAASVGIGGLRSAGAGLVGFLGGPWGAALAAGTLAVGAISSKLAEADATTQSFTQSLLEGGTAAANVETQYRDQYSLEDGEDLDFLQRFGESIGITASLDEARQAADDYRESLSPLAQAQLDVQRETNDVAAAVGEFGVGSAEAREASGNLRYAQDELAQAQRDVALATADANEAIAQSVQESLAASDATIRLSEAQIAARDAEASYQEVMANADATDDERQQSLNNLLQAYNAQVTAAGQKAAADAAGATPAVQAALATAAQVRELDALIAAGGPAVGQLQALRAGMDVSSAGAVIAAAAMDNVTGAVTRIPGERAVRINSLTAEAQANLEALGFSVEHLPDGSVKVTAETAEAEAALNRFTTQRRTITVGVRTVTTNVGSTYDQSGPGLATGGYIRGPGGPTDDRAGLWRLSNGEFVQRAAVVALTGRDFQEALNRGDWATALPRLQELAGRQSTAQLDAMAGAAAARAAGRLAAGGFVDDSIRAAALAGTDSAAAAVPQIGEVVGSKYLGPVYLTDPDAYARQSRRDARAAAARVNLRRG